MAGTVVTTEITHGSVKKIKFDWLSDAAGAADAVTTNVYNGRVIYAAFESDGGGTAPTDLWDCTVKDADGIDICKGLGANVTAAATVYKADSDGLGAVVESALTLAVTNAGNAKGGLVHLYIR